MHYCFRIVIVNISVHVSLCETNHNEDRYALCSVAYLIMKHLLHGIFSCKIPTNDRESMIFNQCTDMCNHLQQAQMSVIDGLISFTHV